MVGWFFCLPINGSAAVRERWQPALLPPRTVVVREWPLSAWSGKGLVGVFPGTVSCPLFDLLCKGKNWEWTPLHEEALQLLVFEAANHQALDPIHLLILYKLNESFFNLAYQCTCGRRHPRVLPSL